MTAGDYAVNRFEVPFTISLDDGWSTDYDWPAGGRLVRADLTRIAWALPVHTFDTQTGVNSPISIADSREFVGYFTAHHPLDYKTPVETRLAGYSGYEWEVRLKSGTACPVDAKSCDLESPSTTWRARTLALDSPHGVVVLSYEATDDAGMDRARSQLATLRFY
jgi:hypothetical protein